jgi:hypothetical protein
VVGRWSRLTFVTVCSSHDATHAGAARLAIVANVIVGRGRSPLEDVACASSCHPRCPPWCFG